jgi:hypothetical protein
MSRQLRQNVRNFLLPMTVVEVQRELELSVEAGDTVRAGYVKEFLCELETESNERENCDGYFERSS